MALTPADQSTDGDTALSFRRSTRCETNNCFEVATSMTQVHLRSSSGPEIISVNHAAWSEFVDAIKADEFA